MARLVSVNVGLPQDVSWHGRTVHTGIWKRPVTGPRMVRRLNIDGDGQGDLAGHGGEMRAVMVYQLDSYHYWQRELGRDDFVHGQFGENFTVEGLADDEVCIGDRYRIGDAVFEVTQPRVTCYRVGLRMAEPRMPALLVSHKRPGFYFRVLTEGEVEAGQDIVKIATGPGRMTVTEVDGLLYLSDHPRDRLERALRIDALSPGWQGSFQALLDQTDHGPEGATGNAGLNAEDAGPGPAWAGFRPLTVARIEEESRSIVSLWLAAPDAAPLPAAAPGQYLTVRLEPDEDGPALVRSYSLSGRPGADQYRISVKREAHGAASIRLHTRVRVGDSLQAAAPRGTFTLASGPRPVILASAGVGATPVLAMLRALADSRSSRQVWWLHGARNGDVHVFAKESRELLKRLPHSHVRICYSRPRAADRHGIDYTDTGRLSAELLTRIGLPTDADAYLCGPIGFMTDLTDALTRQGLRLERVHREIFGAGPAITPGIAPTEARPPHPPTGVAGTGPSVSFARSGLTVCWKPEFGTLLELAEACDVPVRWSCRTGVCHTCETGLLAGSVTYDPDPVEPPTDSTALICCSQPCQDVVLDL
ncbi:MOSC domain-containing protein [Streptomyces inhibens]|uniref:MOSC domain-containing protein n=1 Tax=Streptomyces inhibens TaxID=2293571 RepID=A0A371Q3S9_STRIH|nr:MOSC and FAD-binding oxidoreductase domain-containing protein [Streptomyces inhibens]REK89384.1 MOSC domain-containing protein [Streptomyces inhibens]